MNVIDVVINGLVNKRILEHVRIENAVQNIGIGSENFPKNSYFFRWKILVKLRFFSSIFGSSFSIHNNFCSES